MYAKTERWGKDVKSARLWPDGRMDPLPASVSRYTFVLQPGIGSQIILWGGRENSEGVRPDGSRDSVATRRIWQPSRPDASTIYESWGGWLGEMVACSNSRYLLRIWPHSKQEFICLNSEGKTLWEHKLTLSCYFWPPPPLHLDGTLYLMDTVQSADGQTNNVVLRCLTPSGQTSWELKIDQTKEQPVFESCLSPSGSHILLVRRDRARAAHYVHGQPEADFRQLGPATSRLNRGARPECPFAILGMIRDITDFLAHRRWRQTPVSQDQWRPLFMRRCRLVRICGFLGFPRISGFTFGFTRI